MKSSAAGFSAIDVTVWSGLLKIWGCEDLAALITPEGVESLVRHPLDVDVKDPRFPDRYNGLELLSKFPFVIDGLDRSAVALEKFRAAEEQCAITNRDVVWDRLDRKLIQDARRLIKKVLGDFSIEYVLAQCSFGPGATTSMPRAAASQQYKWQLRGHGTERVLPWFETFCRSYIGTLPVEPRFEVVHGNRVTTVPKNAKTDRVIAIEPDWNMFFQRGVGGAIRHRLQRRLGLLLPNAQSINRMAALQGSLDGSVATLDLSSASDTIAWALVEALLPPDWFRAIEQLRSPVGLVNGKTVAYEKISSMGNGYTFELETLIFWALAKACTGGTVLVYGDDIICNSNDAGVVSLALECCGFEVNTKKSFSVGPFRESCGGHYWHGRDITPCYMKESISPDSPLPARIRLANKVYKLASRTHGCGVLDERMKPLWCSVMETIPRSFYGPADLGDACATAPFDMARPQWNRRLQTWTVKTVKRATLPIYEPHWGAVLSSLWSKSVPSQTHSWDMAVDCAYVVQKVGVSSCKWDRSDIWV